MDAAMSYAFIEAASCKNAFGALPGCILRSAIPAASAFSFETTAIQKRNCMLSLSK